MALAPSIGRLLEYARIRRGERVMGRYLEAMT